MNAKTENPYAALQRIFHEPNRLAIVSALCHAGNGLSFSDLKRECDLTDGNLSRHLRMLEEADIVAIRKGFVGAKPRTTIELAEHGRERFIAYLAALEEVLKLAGSAIEGSESPAAAALNVWNPAEA